MLKDVVAVIGTTGVGKSQLAIDLALSVRAKQKLGSKAAEVINADSMQVYRGLDIITNKSTTDEMHGVPHHLMNFLEPGQEYRVDRFRRDAISKIEEMHEMATLPIVVGGTMYFMQHLLFPGQLVSADEEDKTDSLSNPKSIEELPEDLRHSVIGLSPDSLDLLFKLQDLPSISTPDSFPPGFPVGRLPVSFAESEKLSMGLYNILQAVDPAMAERWHWRDIRKVRRSIEVALQTGRKHSEIIAEQQKMHQRPEYRTLIFWLYANPATLELRLDGRVEKMVDVGCYSEIQEMRKIANENKHVDMSKGIYQAIGYKEFSSYFDECESGEQDSVKQEVIFKQALEDMKTGTRQYARKQVKWIKSKVLPAVKRMNEGKIDTERDVHIYLLDATDLSAWKNSIQDTAIRIYEDFAAKNTMPDAASLSAAAAAFLADDTQSSSKAVYSKRKTICEICTSDTARPFLVEEGEQVKLHERSRGHRKRVEKQSRRYRARPDQAPKGAAGGSISESEQIVTPAD